MANRKPITHNGRSLTMEEWSRETGIPVGTIRSRTQRLGWTFAQAIAAPVDRRFSSRFAGRPAANQPRPCPELKRHARGQAYVSWTTAGQPYQRYLGKWGTVEAAEAYRRFAIEWASGLAEVKSNHGGILISELAAAYIEHAKGYYCKFGELTSEYDCVKSAIALLLKNHAATYVDQFTADDLRQVIAGAVEAGLARRTINGHHWRIIRVFSWGAGQVGIDRKPLVSPVLVASLERVQTLQPGRSAAPEPKKKRSAPWSDVEATFPHLHKNEARRAVLEAAIRVAWLVGMRPVEVVSMRPIDLDMRRAEWLYTAPIEIFKNTHREKEGRYFVGPKARAILAPMLADCPPDRPIFALPPVGNRTEWVNMSREAFGRFVAAACQSAGVPEWTPHQLRHSRATEVQRIYESDAMAAQAIGDSEEVARRVYIDPSDEVAQRIARETG